MAKLSKHPVTIIFDFDGTIADTFSFYLDLLNKLADKFNFQKLDPEKIDFYRNMSSHDIIKNFQIPRLRLPFVIFEAKRLLQKGIEQIHPIDGIKDTLTKLKTRDILLGIITSNSVRNVNAFLLCNNLPQFEFVISPMRIWEKSRTLKKLIINIKLDQANVFYIGDETRDIEAAHEAGIKSIAITWGYNSEAILKSFSPDYLITNPEELVGIVDQILAKSGK
jgi:phosphoglycolate phosphatase